MFKRISTLCFSVVLLFLSLNVSASHMAGASLTYTCVSPNVYNVGLVIYRDCNGISLGTPIQVDYSSAQCGVSGTITLNQVKVTDITPIDPSCSVQSACSGSGQYGIQEYVYQGTLTIPTSGCGSDWKLSFAQNARNAAGSNLTSPDSYDLYVESTLNNTLSSCDNSPQFLGSPSPFYCVNQNYVYNQGVVDNDGDSLVFSFVCPLQATGSCVPYSGSASVSNPMGSNGTISINSQTGDIAITATSTGSYVIAVAVDEYRNGVKIGRVIRDFQFTVLNCSNAPPTASGVNGTTNFSDTICAGAQLCFTINAADVNANQVVTVTSNNGIAIPGSSVTFTGTNPVVATFCWTPSIGDLGNNLFTITVKDNACPLQGVNTYAYTVIVKPNPNGPVDAGPDQTVCAGEAVTLTSLTPIPSGATLKWLSASTVVGTGNGVVVNPTTTTIYTAELTYADGCPTTDNMTVNIIAKPDISVYPGSVNVCVGGTVQLSANSNTAGATITWSPATGLSGAGCPTCTDPIATVSGNITYTVKAALQSGCFSEATVSLNVSTPPPVASCNVIYATTTGSGDGLTTATPTNLGKALQMAACNNTIIKLAVGTYTTDTAITSLTSYTTLEGGFDPITWVKTSQPGATTITRSALNVEGNLSVNPRITAFYINSASYFRFQDITITTANAPAAPVGVGVSTYGVYMTNCANYNFVRCQVQEGAGSAGKSGTAGTAGAAGGNGLNATGRNGASAPTGCTNPGGAGGRGGGGGFFSGGNGSSGSAGSGVGAGGGGNRGTGSVTCAAFGIFSGSAAGPGVAGGAGTSGAAGTAGPGGTIVTGFFTPGAQGGNGTNGLTAGAGGGGGGGTGGAGFNTDGEGGGSGGCGGEPGTGGTGGFGGGGSFGFFINNNGAAGAIINTNVSAAVPGVGGAGGLGGNGGAGGTGGQGRTGGSGCQNFYGDGGNGGAGGAGGTGGTGAAGVGVRVYFASGTPLTNADTIFNLNQPVITVTNISCTNTQVDFTAATADVWDFGTIAVPQNDNGAAVNTKYSDQGRKNITYASNIYTGFVNIALNQNTFVPQIVTTAPPAGPDTFALCTGSSANFVAQIPSATTYEWDFGGAVSPNTYVGPTFATVNGLQFNTAGTYLIKLRISTSCCGYSPYDSIWLVVSDPTVTQVTANPSTFCPGDSVTLTATGAVNYVWTPVNGLSDSVGSVVIAKPAITTTYYVVGTSNGGLCPSIDTVTVTVTPLPVVTFTTVDATCGNNGSITANVSPAGTYQYEWSDSAHQTTATAGNLQAGGYAVTVTGQNGCNAVANASLSAGTGVVAYISRQVDPTCSCNGIVKVKALNGTPGYSYSWNNGVTIDSLSGQCAGNFTVTVTDNAGCSVTATSSLNQASPLKLTLIDSTNSLCDSSTEGSIWVDAGGGTSPYSYAWSPTQPTTNKLTGLVRGTYTVTVTDAKGCKDVLSITLTAPPAIKIDTANVLNPTCTYRTDGSASVVVSGGVGSYSYVWNPNPDTDSVADNIGQGSYSVTVTDGNGCPKSTSFVIQLTDTFAINLTFKNVSCNDASDGKIFVNATGGKPAYSYTWSPSVSTVDSAVVLSPNTYQVTVYDANQCSITGSQVITEPTLLIADTSNVIKNNCFGIADGSATVTPSGGTPGYVLSASDGTNNYSATNNNFSNLPAGSYSYVVTDTNGCSVQGNFDIARAIPDVVVLTTDSATCFQSTDGAIHVKASGNVPYTFSTDSISFVNGVLPDSNTFAGLGKGDYSVFVKNPNGCITKGDVSIGEPEDITATAVPDSVYIELGDSAVLQVNITGVTNPVITWSPAEGLSCTSCTNPIAKPTKDTEYTVKVSRSNNKDCYKDATAKVKVSVEIAIPNAFTPNVDGKNEKFFPISNSTNFTVNAFRIYNRWGELVHGENTPWDGSYKGTPQPAEVYVYHVEITKPDTNNPNVTKTIIKEGSFTLFR